MTRTVEFWSVAELEEVTRVEVEHYVPTPEFDPEGDSLEAYDIKLRDIHGNSWELDVTPEVAKKIYEELKFYFGG